MSEDIELPREYGFPKDEFEFLVELRSLPSDRFYPVYTTLQQQQLQYSLRANKFDMQLVNSPSHDVKAEWVKNHWKEFDLSELSRDDFTENIYNSGRKSHHEGVQNIGDGFKRLTAGVHVHFSSRDAISGEVVNLPIEEIVKIMDKQFESKIIGSGRNLGEWESKAHGFEYRSLPADINIYDVLKRAFTVIRGI